MLAGRFAAVRVRPAHRDTNRSTPRPEEWLLIQWPRDQPEPTKYWLSTLPPTITRRALVDQAKLRWPLSAIIRISSRNSASATTRGARGAVSTTTRHCASRPTDSSSPNAALFSPQAGAGRHPSKHLPYPIITDRAGLPIRPERHVATSMTTLRTTIARALARTLPRRSCCQ